MNTTTNTKGHNKKRTILLATLIPSAFVGVAASTVGALYATGVFDPQEKTPLTSVFATTDGVINGNYVWSNGSDAAFPNDPDHAVDENSVWTNVLSNSFQPGYDSSVRNAIDISLPSSWTRDSTTLNEVIVSAKTTSTEYEGSITVTFKLQPGQKAISDDFKTVAIVLDNLADPFNTKISLSWPEMIDVIQATGTGTNSNANLIGNDIKLQYDSSTDSTPVWTDWDWSATAPKFGINTASSTDCNETLTLTLWNQANQCYTKIRLASNGGSYYADSTPVPFTIKLHRNALSSITNWSTIRTLSTTDFLEQPSAAQVKEAFDAKINADTCKDKFWSKNPNYYFTFPTTKTTMAYITYPGNPYFAPLDSSGSSHPTESQITYAMHTKLAFGTDIITTSQVSATAFNDIFWETPVYMDVKDRVINVLPAATSWIWSDIQITITPTPGTPTTGTITFTAKTGSVYYTSSTTRTYTLKS